MDILVTEDLDSPALQRLAEKYRLLREPSLWREPERLLDCAREARALVIRNQTKVTAELLAAATRLVAVGRIGVGLDNINIPAASKHGVVVVAPLDANAVSVAELTLGFMLALARKIPQADRSTRNGGWDRKTFTGIELDGKTLGICGLGRIGRMVAARARAFGMALLAYDPFVKADSPVLRDTGIRLCPTIEELLANSDFITVHLPLTPDTKHLFNAKTLTMTKPAARFINTSRGGVVDEQALVAALNSGRLAGAALDVREVEPPGAAAALEKMDNVILAPHVGAFTAEAQTRTFEAVATDLDRLLSGQPARNFVNFDRPRR